MWNLGPFELDPATFHLARDGAPIGISRRPFDLLVALVSRAGRVLSREELRTRVWQGATVSEGALDTALYEARAAIGDLERASADRWIETVRGRGLRYRGPVERRVGLQAPQDGIPFVGREALVRDLSRTVKRALGGEGGFVVIDGVAGMGKTRLLQEIVREVDAASVTTAWCETGGPPYWPWIQLIEGVDPGSSGSDWLEVPRSAHADEAMLFDRQRRIEERLLGAARERPRVLLIEDLHWADAPSVAMLETLAPRLQSWPIAILATSRTENDDGRPLAHLAGSPHVQRVDLRPLDNAAVLKFVEPILGRIPPPDVASQLLERSEGIPLFVRELAEQTRVDEDGRFRLPPVATTVLERRFTPLAEATRLPLAVAALCGERFDVPLVEAAMRDRGPGDRGWIRDARQHGILEADPRNPLRFAFRHALMRDVAEGSLAPDDVAHWHRRIADAIVERAPEPQGQTLSRLAHHYAAAALLEADLQQPLRFVLRAARAAAKVRAWQDVRDQTEHVLGWLPNVPHTAERDDQEREVRLLRCAAIAGQSGHVEETERHLARLDALLAKDPAPDADARALMAAFRYSNARAGGRVRDMRAAAEEAEGIAGLRPIASCWRRAAAALAGHTEEAVAPLGDDDGLPSDPDLRDLAGRMGWDPWTDQLGLSAFACWATGDEAEARRRAQRAIEWASEQGDVRSEVWARFLFCLLLDLLEDWEALSHRGPEFESFCSRHGLAPWRGFGFGMQVWAHARLSRLDSSTTDRLGEIMVTQGRATNTSFKTAILFSAARSYAFAECFDEAEATLDEIEAFARATGERVLLPEVHREQALLAVERGEQPRAAEHFRRAIDTARDQGARDLEARARRARAEAGLAPAEPDEATEERGR